MKIKAVNLNQFKRFTDLTITNIPESTKLVIIAGPNGCGKSSLFDGMKSWHQNWKGQGHNWIQDYHSKQGSGISQNNIDNTVKVTVHGQEPPADTEERKKALYIRTAYRNDPQIQVGSLQKVGSQLDENRFNILSENDVAVGKNYQRLASQAFRDVFVEFDGNRTVSQFRQHVIGDIRTSLRNVFSDLNINDLGNPLEDGTFFFAKGVSQRFDYRNLSGGEKAAFDLILDMVVKSRDYNNTIFCIDEPELHMNTRLQGALLGELYRLVNEDSQLWIATHSIGMMRKAKDMAVQHPDKVVFIDFDNRNFDEPQVITPIKPNRAFWENVLHVALDDLAELVTPKKIVICEGVPRGTAYGPNVAHDAECLNTIFSEEFPDVKFLAGGNSHEVSSDKHALIGAIEALSRGAEIIKMIDRDDHSPQDIQNFKDQNIKVLSRRHLESYLFDDEVLTALCESIGQGTQAPALIAEKQNAIQASIDRRNAPDDIKSASEGIYQAAKRLLGLTACGNNARAFMRSTLAPLIRPGMAVYQELKVDIFSQT
jgi:predicted ATPase